MCQAEIKIVYIKAKRGSDAIWEAARQLVPEARPGDFNQALMELGATCCTPKAPGCCACPVRATCAVSKKAEQLQVPCEEHALRDRTDVVIGRTDVVIADDDEANSQCLLM